MLLRYGGCVCVFVCVTGVNCRVRLDMGVVCVGGCGCVCVYVCVCVCLSVCLSVSQGISIYDIFLRSVLAVLTVFTLNPIFLSLLLSRCRYYTVLWSKNGQKS